ncbi:MAG TPA: hypothetical protein VNI02_24225 [Blastocatellia bacterium]|nr:hypothetical protein [Blastocatellia bacterium]
MRNRRPLLVMRLICCLAAAISLLMARSITSLAQQPGPPPGPIDPKSASRQREVRETILRNAEVGAEVEKRDQRRIEAAIEQVKQDFKQIQIIRNEMVRDLLANKPLDYKSISDKAGEINKRADRLKAYLMPPAPDDKEKNQKSPSEFNNEEMKGALVQLCNRIAVFIENPVLKTPGINDVEQSAKAGGDLLSIIQLSSNIKRSADRLSKGTK